MLRKYGLPLLALIGVAIGLAAVVMSARKPVTPPIPFAPPIPPYTHFIVGSATVEAASENISIGTSIAEVATDVYVVAGDVVAKGTPLFKLDTRTFEAQLSQAEADRARAIVEYENQKTQLDLYDRLTDKRAVSENEYNQVFFATEAAKVAILQAEARIDTARTYIERSTLRAPMDGKVLQVAIRVGEIANLNPFSEIALMTFGPVCPTNVRVDIDEDDAWRYKQGAPAVAFVRGNSSICFPLKFVRLEPLVIAKESLTGGTAERVDTRVLQAIYQFQCQDLPVYVGQILDVYIEAIPATTRYDDAKNRCY
jgi:HlyD family secretion protein